MERAGTPPPAPSSARRAPVLAEDFRTRVFHLGGARRQRNRCTRARADSLRAPSSPALGPRSVAGWRVLVNPSDGTVRQNDAEFHVVIADLAPGDPARAGARDAITILRVHSLDPEARIPVGRPPMRSKLGLAYNTFSGSRAMIQITSGKMSAIRLKRSSLSRRAASVRVRSIAIKGNVAGPPDQREITLARSSWFRKVHRERPEHLVVPRHEWLRPGRAEPVAQCRVPIVDPEPIVSDIGRNHQLSPKVPASRNHRIDSVSKSASARTSAAIQT